MPDSNASNAADVRRIIEEKNADLESWYAAGRIDRVAECFAEEVWQMPPGSPPLVGRAALRDFWAQAVQWGDWRFILDTADVIVSGDLAVERGRYTLRFQAGPQAPEHMESFADRGNYVVVWQHDDDGEWRILWDAPVSELPPGVHGEEED